MSSGTQQGAQLLHGFRRMNRFSKGLGSQLPEAYKKFWNEWKHQTPAAVHYIPKEEKYRLSPKDGLVRPVQNVPIPLKRVKEENQGIWGGEAVIQGFRKKKPLVHRVPYFWVPTLKRSVVRSVVLNEYMSVVVTDRTIRLINENYGFDHYLLNSPACDLRSELALKIKRNILHAIRDGFPAWAHDENRQKELLNEYGKYLDQYTPEELEWYGLTWIEAIHKKKMEIREENPVVPYKTIFREKLIEQLRAAGIEEAKEFEIEPEKSTSWIKKLNPFSKET